MRCRNVPEFIICFLKEFFQIVWNSEEMIIPIVHFAAINFFHILKFLGMHIFMLLDIHWSYSMEELSNFIICILTMLLGEFDAALQSYNYAYFMKGYFEIILTYLMGSGFWRNALNWAITTFLVQFTWRLITSHYIIFHIVSFLSSFMIMNILLM